MDVKIISREMIKPSSPTPQALRTFNLSLLDQLAPCCYFPILLFYISPAHPNPCYEPSPRLKESLSKALTVFYPLAGRIRDDLSCIDCNDEGVMYVEARVAGDMLTVALGKQNTQLLQPLLPCSPLGKFAGSSSQAILAVQVSYFDCGGIAVGVCLWHEAGDASTLASFLKKWAAICSRGPNDVNSNIIDGLVFGCSSIFRGQDLRSFSEVHLAKPVPITEIGLTRVSFKGSKIAALREKIGTKATRFEALTALICGAVLAATGKKNRARTGIIFSMAVNFRKRLSPPLPDGCIGNIYQDAHSNWPNNDETGDYSGLVQAIPESLKMMNNERIRYLHREGRYLKLLAGVRESNGTGEVSYTFSSWCRFPFYEADFGWGKPVWFCPGVLSERLCLLVDARDGEGVEAWVGLPKEDMEKFLQNPGILAYASFAENYSNGAAGV